MTNTYLSEKNNTNLVAANQTFDFNGNSLSVLLDDYNNPWFIAKEVCKHLELDNVSKACSGLDDDEKGITKVHTLGGMQDNTVINESGLYRLTMRSNKPEAKKFQKWVTNEVLPEIRKTGSYNSKPQLPDFTNPVLAARAWADEVEQKQLALENLSKTTEQLAIAQPKADTLDMISETDGLLSVAEAAKNLGISSAQKLNKILIEWGWKTTTKLPSHDVIEKGWMKYHTYNENGIVVKHLYFTPRGFVVFSGKYSKYMEERTFTQTLASLFN